MQKFFSILTQKGLNDVLDALNTGKKVTFATMIYGDGGGKPVVPYPSQTTLVNELGNIKVNYVRVKGDISNIIEVSGIIPADRGGFVIREVGLRNEAGELVAVGNCPDTTKVTVEDGIVSELEIIMEIIVTNTDGISLQINPSVIGATKQDVQALDDRLSEMINNHINNKDIHVTKEEKNIWNALKNYDDTEIREIINTLAHKRRSYTMTIPAVGWSQSAPYKQRIAVNGMVPDGLPLYDLIEYTEQSAEDYMKLTKLETFENEVEVTALLEKPVGNIKIRIEVTY